MNDWLLLQLTAYGVPLLFLTTYLSCLAVPVPSSLMMLAAGAFVASGDLTFGAVTSAALAGAVLGDQSGYRLGTFGRTRTSSYISAHPKRAALFSRAQDFTARWGGPGVFLSRWLISPLGPYVNFASGITRQSWTGFTVWAILGEIIWVLLYVGLGFTFAQNIDAVAEIAADMSGIIAGSTLTIGLGLWLRRVLRDHHHPPKSEENNVQRPDHPH